LQSGAGECPHRPLCRRLSELLPGYILLTNVLAWEDIPMKHRQWQIRRQFVETRDAQRQMGSGLSAPRPVEP
jgi:hypothetical protein